MIQIFGSALASDIGYILISILIGYIAPTIPYCLTNFPIKTRLPNETLLI